MKHIEINPVADAVTDEIRSAILDGSLAPGCRVKQEELAARLQVSRAPIRHALMVLKREGLVQMRHHRGATVAPLDPGFISDIYDLREAIEGYAAARLAERASFDPAPLWTLIANGQQAVTSGDLTRIIEADLSFHMGLYEALGNKPLTSIMDAQWWHFRRAMAATLSVSGYRTRVWDEHAAILKAIVAGEPERAQQLSIAHTRAARSVLLHKIKQFLSAQSIEGRTAERIPPRRGRAALHRGNGHRTAARP